MPDKRTIDEDYATNVGALKGDHNSLNNNGHRSTVRISFTEDGAKMFRRKQFNCTKSKKNELINEILSVAYSNYEAWSNSTLILDRIFHVQYHAHE
uniref:Uncharacterized protein n=1 Tax=Romanomermis culicivorax TaxID=13658 RepID=A0A915JZH3_ROMCU